MHGAAQPRRDEQVCSAPIDSACVKALVRGVVVRVYQSTHAQRSLIHEPTNGERCAPAETLYHRDDALLYIAYVMLIWAAPIPADRWHCSLWP